MMVEGTIQGQKVREGHWAPGKNGGVLRIKLDNEPMLGKVDDGVVLRYGTILVPVQVELVSWNKTYGEVTAEVIRK